MNKHLSKKDEWDFSVVMGTLFSISTTVEYLDAVKVVMEDRKASYAYNKSREAEKSCTVVKNTLERELIKNLSPEEKVLILQSVEDMKEMVYSFMAMSAVDQKRVKGLIKKVNAERDIA